MFKEVKGKVELEKGKGVWWKIKITRADNGQEVKLIGKVVERYFDEQDSVDILLAAGVEEEA